MKELDQSASNDELDEVTRPATPPLEPDGAEQTPAGNSRRHWLKSTLAASAGLAALNLPAVSAAQSLDPPPPVPIAEAAPPSVATPGTTYISFSGLDFRPAASAITFDWSSANYCGIYSVSGSGLFTAKLSVPDQAKITEIQFYIKHNLSGTTIFYLIGTSATLGSGGSIASAILATPINATIQTVNLSGSLPWVVDNATTGFYLGWFPANAGTNEILYGARVGYTGGVGRFKPS